MPFLIVLYRCIARWGAPLTFKIPMTLVLLVLFGELTPKTFAGSLEGKNTEKDSVVLGGSSPLVVYDGDSVFYPGRIKRLEFFQPIFSPDRVLVNPTTPRLETSLSGTFVYFDNPGEYYLKFSKGSSFKILVLQRDSAWSLRVLQLFNFLTANLISHSRDDDQWVKDPEGFARDFFSSTSPKLLLCGPSLGFFQSVVSKVFKLPTRDVTFTGVSLKEGQVQYGTHNVLEVYLPDLKRWVLFDINNGFVARGMSAFDLTDHIYSMTAGGNQPLAQGAWFRSLDIPLEVQVRKPNSTTEPISVNRGDVGSWHEAIEDWDELGKVISVGPGYWGGARFQQRRGLPDEFELYSSKYLSDPFLLEAQKRWVSNWSLKMRHIDPRELENLLDVAYANQIAAQEWKTVDSNQRQ